MRFTGGGGASAGPWSPSVQAALAGAVLVAAFAPFLQWWLAPLALAVLFRLWLRHPAQRTRTGFCFGLGLFITGVHWIYISLHDHGGMPAPLAALALLGFAAFCALIPAAAGWLTTRVAPTPSTPSALLGLPAAWTLLEWTRVWFCTGFPWLATGYSQVPNSPLAAWLPLGGVYAASLMVALCAGALAQLSLLPVNRWRTRAAWPALALLAGVALTSAAAGALQFTRPDGAPLQVALLQGNIAQDDKFDPDHLADGLRTYRALANASQAALIVMPESAVPLLHDEVPASYLDDLTAIGRRNGGDLLVGMFDEPQPGEIHNSMFSLGTAPTQVYRKHHLVPFGEFIPLGGLVGPVMNALLRMPIGSQAAGPLGQGVMAVAGQRVAMDICYEDAFGEEIITALPGATLLVNVSNDAWFGMAVGPEQHLQMAQARSLETGRMMLRTTNTGVTAIIDARGQVVQRAPKGAVATLEATVQGRQGATPFVRTGNLPVVLACVLLLLVCAWQSRRNLRESAT